MHPSRKILKVLFRKGYRVIQFATVIAVSFSPNMLAYAAPSDVSLTLGDARVDQTSTYTLDANTVDSSVTIRCVELDLGSSSDGSGGIAGLDTSNASFDGSTLLPTPGNWAIDNAESANHTLRATYTTGETLNSAGNIVWGGVTNGSTAETPYYGVFSTYTDSSCSTVVESAILAFVYTNGQLVSVSVGPSITFSIDSVASSQSSAGTITTAATTNGTISFGPINTAANGVAAHDVVVSANTDGGYDVYLRYTQALTNTVNGSATVDDHSGTYASPSPFPMPGVESFGYHTDDIAAFNASDFAAFTSTGTGDSVMNNAAATVGTETTRVTYQVGIGSATESGTYETTLIYTLVPVF